MNYGLMAAHVGQTAVNPPTPTEEIHAYITELEEKIKFQENEICRLNESISGLTMRLPKNQGPQKR